MTSFLQTGGDVDWFLLESEADGTRSGSSTPKKLETREQELVNRNGSDMKQDKRSEGQVQCTEIYVGVIQKKLSLSNSLFLDKMYLFIYF